jgi:hypothetical protein
MIVYTRKEGSTRDGSIGYPTQFEFEVKKEFEI